MLRSEAGLDHFARDDDFALVALVAPSDDTRGNLSARIDSCSIDHHIIAQYVVEVDLIDMLALARTRYLDDGRHRGAPNSLNHCLLQGPFDLEQDLCPLHLIEAFCAVTNCGIACIITDWPGMINRQTGEPV